MHSNKGFTLLDLLVTIAIIIILAGIAIPLFQKYYRTYKYKEYDMQVESTLKWARIVAMERSTNVSVCVQGSSIVVYDNGAGGQPQCSGTVLRRVDITDNFIGLEITSRIGGVSFDPRGLSNWGGTIRIRRTDPGGGACREYAVQVYRGFIHGRTCQ